MVSEIARSHRDDVHILAFLGECLEAVHGFVNLRPDSAMLDFRNIRNIRRIPMRFALAALAIFLFAFPVAADPIEDDIKARRAYYTLLGANMGPLAAMAKGEVEYNAERAQLFADNMALMASYSPLLYFPEASSKDDRAGKTRALAKIWSDFDGFKSKFEDFQKAAANMKAEAGKGRAALGPAVGKLGGTCKACHDDYRAKDF